MSADALSSGPFGTFASIRWNVILEAISDVNGLFVLIESGATDVVRELLATYGFDNDRLITGGGRDDGNNGCVSLGFLGGCGAGGYVGGGFSDMVEGRIVMYLELSPFFVNMESDHLGERNQFLTGVLSHKATDKVAYLFGMGRLSEDNGMPTISHLFYSEALEELKLGSISGLYQISDVDLAISRIELNHPGLVKPNVVMVHIEPQKDLKTLIRDIFQNTMIRSLSLLSVGVLIPYILSWF